MRVTVTTEMNLVSRLIDALSMKFFDLFLCQPI